MVRRSIRSSKINFKNLIYAYVFACIVLIGCVSIFLNVDVINVRWSIIMTFIINGIIIFFELSRSSKLGYSLKDILFLFMFIFMFVSPLVQYFESSFPWWDTHLITEDKILHTNFVIFIFLVVYLFVYQYTFRYEGNNFKNREIINIKLVMNIFFIATVICSIYLIAKTGFSNLFSRSTNKLQIESSSMALIISHTFNSVSVIYVGMNLLFAIKNKYIYNRVHFLIGCILMLLVNFPTSSARYWMASVYIGLFIIIVKRIKNPYVFKILIFIGILVVFPALNTFRYHTFQDVVANGVEIPRPYEAFLEGHFDTYSMLVRSIIYTDYYGLTWGNQLLGNLLFFIPRKIWPAKPIGSGAMIGRTWGWPFTNVSCPYIGEGYINFGLFGVVLFAVILALICKSADTAYQKQVLANNKSVTFIELIYPFSLGFLFFILRGDLLSSFSYYIGFMVPVIILWILHKLKLLKLNV